MVKLYKIRIIQTKINKNQIINLIFIKNLVKYYYNKR